MNAQNNTNNNRRMVQLRFVLIPIAIIIASILLLAIVSAMAPKPAKKPIVIKPPLVDVEHIERQNITFQVASQGSVMPRTETMLISEVSGMVDEVSSKFKVGGFFKKGEQMLSIDDITYQVALVQAQSRLGSAKAVLLEEEARTRQAEEEWKLSGRPMNEAPELALRLPQRQKAEAELLAASADVKAAKIKLERTKIVAPYDAMVKAKNVDIGQFVSTGTQLAQTFAVDYAEVRLPIKQKDVEFLILPSINELDAKGATVELSYEILGKTRSWQSHLTRSEGVVDSVSRVHYAIAQLDDPYALLAETDNKQIKVGTFVKATITGRVLEDIIAIPRSSIYGANTVFTIDKNNKLHIRRLELLRSDADFVYTLEEFENDRRLVVTRVEAPVEGMTLRVSGEEEPEPVEPTTDVAESAQGED